LLIILKVLPLTLLFSSTRGLPVNVAVLKSATAKVAVRKRHEPFRHRHVLFPVSYPSNEQSVLEIIRPLHEPCTC